MEQLIYKNDLLSAIRYPFIIVAILIKASEKLSISSNSPLRASETTGAISRSFLYLGPSFSSFQPPLPPRPPFPFGKEPQVHCTISLHQQIPKPLRIPRPPLFTSAKCTSAEKNPNRKIIFESVGFKRFFFAGMHFRVARKRIGFFNSFSCSHHQNVFESETKCIFSVGKN